MTARKPAKAPARRSVHILIEEGEYAGWECDAYVDFKAKVLADFQSEDMERVLRFLDKCVTNHNFPDGDDPTVIAASMGEVEVAGLRAVTQAIFDAVAKLPNR